MKKTRGMSKLQRVMWSLATAEGDGVQLKQTLNPGEAISEDTDDSGDDKKHTSPRDGCFT